MRIHLWKKTVTSELDAAHLDFIRTVLENQASDQTKEGGCRILRQVMKQLVKGEVSMRLEVWRQRVKADAHARSDVTESGLKLTIAALRSELNVVTSTLQEQKLEFDVLLGQCERLAATKGVLESDLSHKKLRLSELECAIMNVREEQRGSGLRMLQNAFSYLVKGEFGLRVRLWRFASRDAKAAKNVCAMKTETKGILSEIALRQMKQVIARFISFELATRTLIWRSKVETDMFLQKRSIQVGNAMRELKGEVGRMLAIKNDNLAMRICIWRVNMKDEMRGEQIAWVQNVLELKASMETRITALRQMSWFVYNLVRSTLPQNLEVWRSKTIGERAVEKVTRKLIQLKHREGSTRVAHVMHAIIHGNVADSLFTWRSNAIQQLNHSNYMHQIGIALRDLKVLIHNMLHTRGMEIRMRLYLWRVATKDQVRGNQLAMVQKVFESRSKDELKKQATKQFCYSMLRLIKGRIALMLETWSVSSREQTKSKNQLSLLMQKRGVRQMRLLTSRAIRGEAAMRIVIWRTNMHTAKSSESRYRLLTKGIVKLREYTEIMSLLQKSGIGNRFFIWRSGMRKHANQMALTLIQKQSKYLRTMLSRENGAMQLSHVLVRELDSEPAVRRTVYNWRCANLLHSRSNLISDVSGIRRHMEEESLSLEVLIGFCERTASAKANLEADLFNSNYHGVESDMQSAMLAAQAAQNITYFSLSQLRRARWRIVMNQLHLNLESWRDGLVSYNIQAQKMMQMRIETELGALRKRSAVKRIHGFFATAMRNVMRGRLTSWRKEMCYENNSELLKTESQGLTDKAKRECDRIAILQFVRLCQRIVDSNIHMRIEAWKYKSVTCKHNVERSMSRVKAIKVASSHLGSILEIESKKVCMRCLEFWRLSLTENQYEVTNPNPNPNPNPNLYLTEN